MLLPAAGEKPGVGAQVQDGGRVGRELTGRRCAGGAEGAGGAGLVRGAAARWAGDAAVPRSAPCGRRGRELALPGGRCRWEPSCLRSDSCAALIPGSRGAGRRTPRPWGRGQRRCRRRQKPRRCESGGLRAPFLCRETESGLEGARRLAPRRPVCRGPWAPRGCVPGVFRNPSCL